jgi:acyl-CoA dehydrogenase
MSTISTDSAVQPPPQDMLFDTESLRSFLLSEVPSIFQNRNDKLTAFQFIHGQSNPTYLISIGSKKFVLRKQPPGSLLHGAHNVLREASIIQHLSTIEGLPVTKVFCICSNANIIGTPFYIMEHVKGVVYTDPALPTLTPRQRTMAYSAASRVLAAIHSVQVGRFMRQLLLENGFSQKYQFHNLSYFVVILGFADRGLTPRATRQWPQLL